MVPNPAPQAYTHWIQGAIGRARQETHARMAKYADMSCKEASRYRNGDAVMLSTKNLRPSKELDHKFVGPFQVKRVISPSAMCSRIKWQWEALASSLFRFF